MDLIRLALERSKTVLEALNILSSLLDKHGQGGPSKRGKELGRFYQNSFIIADSKEAWVLETADKFWIAEKVKNVRSISNTLTIGKEYDLIHPNLIQHAIKKGYCKSKKDFHFSKCFIPKFRIYHVLKETQQRSHQFAGGSNRFKCTTSLLLKSKGGITPKTIMSVLRDHNISSDQEVNWTASKASAGSVCHHATGITVPDQTTGSHVAHLKTNIQVHWITGTSAPCTGIFKPIFLPKPGIVSRTEPGDENYNSKNLWWHHERLHRLVLKDYRVRLKAYEGDRDKLEMGFIKKVNDLLTKLTGKITKEDIQTMAEISNSAFTKSKEKTEEWIEKIKTIPIKNRPGLFYRRFWNYYNKVDKVPLDDA